MMRGIVVALVFACGSTAAAQPKTGPRAQADAVYAEGQTRYAAGEYLVAADLFKRAYNLDPDPAYLFNIGQAYRLGRDCAQALQYYNDFLVRDPNPPNLAKVREYIEQCSKPATDPALPPTWMTAPSRRADERPIVTSPSRQIDEPRNDHRGIAAILGAAGVVGLAGGIVLSIRVHDLQHERDSLCPPDPPFCVWSQVADRASQLDASARHATVAGIAFYGIGGAAIVAAGVVYVSGRRSGEPSLTLVPAPGGTVVAIDGRF